ncbi:MAG: hypothetical protein JSS89_09120 [Bacteroidetes bacterium]|nr:hypothetical protein [Bacteroidota bacterium]
MRLNNLRSTSVVIALVLLGMVSGGTSASAQQRYLTSLNWSIGFPTGNLDNYTPSTSFSGFSADLRFLQPDRTFFGVSGGWNYFSDLLRNATVSVENGAIYGTQVRTVNAIPLLASAGMFFDDGTSNMHPYAAINVGAYSVNQRVEIGLVQINNNNWHFGVAPEVGLMIDLERTTAFNAQARYNRALSSGTALNGSSDNSYGWWSLNLGFTFTGW